MVSLVPPVNFPAAVPATPLRQELAGLFQRARARKYRSRRQWALDELRPATGPHADMALRIENQPLFGLWYDVVDRGPWKKRITTGPTQSGKSLLSFVSPIMYHVFEIGETVGIGIPNMDIADDKWRRDIKPVIERSRYRDLLPTRGEGSEGGKVKNAITLRNGAELKFFSSGGGDKERAAYTVRVMVVTETDAFARSGETSHEGSKLEQVLGRTRAFDDQAEIYMECTVTIAEGPTWSGYQVGTESRIACPCPYCGQHVTPEREHLRGWQGHDNVVEAKLAAAFHCPLCDEEITDEQRVWMNRYARLVHRGQEILPGPIPDEPWHAGLVPLPPQIVGAPALTDTFGFRWSAFHNLFTKTASIAAGEWHAARKTDEDEAERTQRQQVWCLPYEPPITAHIRLKAEELCQRQLPLKQGLLPDWTQRLTVGVDLGKRLGHLFAGAWKEHFRGHVPDYAKFPIAGDTLKVDRAIYFALCALRDRLEVGYALASGARRVPDQVWIDSKYAILGVFWFLHDKKTKACLDDAGRPRYWAAQGFGSGQYCGEHYHRPKKRTNEIVEIGDHWHVARRRELRGKVIEVSSDHWKTQLHEGLSCDPAADGAITLFAVDRAMEHLEFCKGLCAEEQQTVYEPGKGDQERWFRINRYNHPFDAGYLCMGAANRVGIRSDEALPKPTAAVREQEVTPLKTPYGQPYFVGARK